MPSTEFNAHGPFVAISQLILLIFLPFKKSYLVFEENESKIEFGNVIAM